MVYSSLMMIAAVNCEYFVMWKMRNQSSNETKKYIVKHNNNDKEEEHIEHI